MQMGMKDDDDDDQDKLMCELCIISNAMNTNEIHYREYTQYGLQNLL
jgi:hypothetical protein